MQTQGTSQSVSGLHSLDAVKRKFRDYTWHQYGKEIAGSLPATHLNGRFNGRGSAQPCTLLVGLHSTRIVELLHCVSGTVDHAAWGVSSGMGIECVVGWHYWMQLVMVSTSPLPAQLHSQCEIMKQRIQILYIVEFRINSSLCSFTTRIHKE